eukprot:6182815-Pleurochrysis_carterae.AAC.3
MVEPCSPWGVTEPCSQPPTYNRSQKATYSEYRKSARITSTRVTHILYTPCRFAEQQPKCKVKACAVLREHADRLQTCQPRRKNPAKSPRFLGLKSK